MNRISKFCCLAVVFASGLWSTASIGGPQKLYSVSTCVGTFAFPDDKSADPTKCNGAQVQQLEQQTIPTPIQVRIFNQSPPTSNSSINAIDLFVDVNWQAVQDDFLMVRDNTGKWNIDVSTVSHVKINNLAPVKTQQFVTVQFHVNNFSCGIGTWNATAYTGSTVGSGATFAPVSGFVPPQTNVACTRLTCGNSLSNIQPQGQVPASDAHFILQLTRGVNQDGSSGANCSDLFTYITPTVTSTTGQVQTQWDKNQPDSGIAVFSYTINLVNTAGRTVSQELANMRVAWLTKPDGTPDFQQALLCDGSPAMLPAQYTTLIADNGSKITVASTAGLPTTGTFSIVMQQERLLVTKVNTNTDVLTVMRGIGGTTAITHAPGTPVMSTPFPIVQAGDGYIETFHPYVSLPAKVCIADITTDLTGKPTTARAFDGGDGWVLGR